MTDAGAPQYSQQGPDAQQGSYPQPYSQYPGYSQPVGGPDAIESPRYLRYVVGLLVVNLALSVVLTVVTVLARHSIVSYQLDHRHVTDPAARRTLRDSYSYGLVGRVVGNIVVSVVYAFLVRALLRGRRWAYRRVIFLGVAGIVGLVIIQASPYPTWMRVEQLVQAVVLALLVFFVTRPAVRNHFASGLPGRDVRRFNR